MSSFREFHLHKDIQQAIYDMGFEEPSPIQQVSIPHILEGKDIIGQAQTGTGKTAAFGIPLIERTTPAPRIQALVLTPTRELAIQVSGELRRIAKYKQIRTLPIYGGQSIEHQIRALRQGVQVVIGTPGRILDHLHRKTLRLDNVRMLVLDEADEMLDMGFIEDIEKIISYTPVHRQTMLFSATMPPEIKRLAQRYLQEPESVSVSRGEVTTPLVEQVYYRVLEKDKFDALCRVLDDEGVQLGILFCRTKKNVDEVTENLQARGYLADGLHGDLSQVQRDRVMKKFREGKIEILVATDVAARGIDVDNVSHVINYDIPQDPESYVHRIGRTGRAGKKGIALTFVTPREMRHLHMIQKETQVELNARALPSKEQVTEKLQEEWKRRILDALSERSNLEPFEEIVEDLSHQHSPLEVAAVAIKLAFTQPDSIDEGYKFGDTGASKGMVRFFLNVGKNVKLERQQLVTQLNERIGISAKEVGRIDIFEKFSFIEVAEEVAPFVYESLRSGRLQGIRINIEPAKPRLPKSNDGQKLHNHKGDQAHTTHKDDRKPQERKTQERKPHQERRNYSSRSKGSQPTLETNRDQGIKGQKISS
ncbi:DEAD/DEAH box helicase [Rubeoparvulum massiliense]|uniref:DEAD/DEAH box helicase n=1 Tax=Rubeoparvulum massiliense TaxID=1631346 RepID=UPI000977ABDC|nr:DEAD/DEAH box helicase [Rubeoparvulum massiliense]